MELEIFVVAVVFPVIVIGFVIFTCWDTFSNAWQIDRMKKEEQKDLLEI